MQPGSTYIEHIDQQNIYPQILNVAGTGVARAGENAGTARSTEKEIAAIKATLTATDPDGNRIFTDNGQWYAVYKVMSELKNYPSDMKAFCDIMTNYGMDKADPPCRYESVKKIPQNVNMPSTKVSLWSNFMDKADPKFRKQIVVAMRLIDELGIG